MPNEGQLGAWTLRLLLLLSLVVVVGCLEELAVQCRKGGRELLPSRRSDRLRLGRRNGNWLLLLRRLGWDPSEGWLKWLLLLLLVSGVRLVVGQVGQRAQIEGAQSGQSQLEPLIVGLLLLLLLLL